MRNFFKGLKVVELAGVLAGPSAGFFFAELGATVIKIENSKTGGDITRTWKLAREDKKQKGSAYYYSVNLLKKIIFADLSDPLQNKKVRKLIADADVVIVNFKKGDAEKFGLDYKALKENNSSLIYASISGFGEEDDRVAYDLVLQAESGFMSMNGTEASGPVKMPVALIDLLAAHQLKEAVLLALLNRYKTKKGCKVSVSLFDSALASLANQASNFLNADFVAGLQGSMHPNIAPYGEVFATQDKKLVTFAIGSDSQFVKLCDLLGLPGVREMKIFRSNSARVRNRRILADLLGEKVKKLKAEALIDLCTQQGIPAARIKKLNEVLDTSAAKKLFINENTVDGVKRTLKTFVAGMNINK